MSRMGPLGKFLRVHSVFEVVRSLNFVKVFDTEEDLPRNGGLDVI